MRYFVTLSYDGAAYHGWQIQPNANSVQETLQNAFSTILRQDIEIVGAGRTDTGVNASKMIAHFDVFTPIDAIRLVKQLNRLMPQDIAIQNICPVVPDAHARFSALSRTYHYHILLSKSPFLRHYAYRYPLPLDFQLMNEAAQQLFNYTDFTSFSKLHTDTKTNNCKIMRAEWIQDDAINWTFVIQADRFLRNMVRAIVGTLLDVGRGKLTIPQFCQVIESQNRCAAGSSVPPHALFLSDITYPDNIFINNEE
ncbi:MAG: tRNA pseudouridine(38-40) synthase TruA [Bacteroidaceae bacterium]|nr:tRNA pseudouridine(38-40) synthase TruA [Bacteroidaceae bacterium]